ncbi:MAG: hypothetical protein Q7S22_02650 [Candidatus Micrarchaeota archaeon]|nr:hypothetical protein [Candidatus Micrarchaeota archaeon]
MENREWLKKTSVIRLNEISRRVSSKAYAKLLVHRLIKSGKLSKITKGIYSASDDIFSIASNIYFPSYISGLSASYRYGITEVIPIIITIITGKKHKRIEHSGYKIEFIQSKKVWGYHKEGNDNEAVFIADFERLVIDVFFYPKQMGNFDEIENIFKSIEKIDVEKLKGYLKRVKSNKIYRQVGYMLEKYRGLDISNLMKINRNYYQLNPFVKKGKTLDRKWRLYL